VLSICGMPAMKSSKSKQNIFRLRDNTKMVFIIKLQLYLPEVNCHGSGSSSSSTSN
jgi:hypothetical protein